MNIKTLKISKNFAFLVTDQSGNITDQLLHGFFRSDTRHLSLMKLLINDAELDLLTSDEISYNRFTVALRNIPSKDFPQDSLSIIISAVLEEFLHINIKIKNNFNQPLKSTLKIKLDVDFADILELMYCRDLQIFKAVKRNILKEFNSDGNYLLFKYFHNEFERQTKIHFSQKAKFDGQSLLFQLDIESGELWKLDLSIVPSTQLEGSGLKPVLPKNQDVTKDLENYLNNWGWSLPKIDTDWDSLKHSYSQGLFDLASLQIGIQIEDGQNFAVIAAGLPWFMTLFGRDSLITSYQTIMLGPKLAFNTLSALASFQGQEVNNLKEEEPGKILHEIRFGEVAYFKKDIEFPYFGSIDSTPLFLILLSEYYSWTGNNNFINQMKKIALDCLNWIDHYGDMDGDGFIEYVRKAPRGLENQGWRDSFNSMVFNDGQIAEPPISDAVSQGYAYDAKLRIAEIARGVWKDYKLAEDLEKQARKLKKNFNKFFWIKDAGYFALGLDKNKQRIDSLSSVSGQLLWSGIIEGEKIPKAVDSLLSTDLYSDWGIRTLGIKSSGYNPIGYHLGTVWPHDNSLAIAGLFKYGYFEEGFKIISSLNIASAFYNYHWPELFSGYSKGDALLPIQYPTSSNPQSWSAGAIALIIRSLLGLEPDLETKTIKINPHLPPQFTFLKLGGISAFGQKYNIEAGSSKGSIIRAG